MDPLFAPPRNNHPRGGHRSAFAVRRIIVSAATTRRTPGKWATIRIASRRSSSGSPPMPCCRRARLHRRSPYPSQTKNVHFEMELVAAIGKQRRDIPPSARSIRSSATRSAST